MLDLNVSWSSLAGFNLLHSSVWIIPDLENNHSEGMQILHECNNLKHFK